MTRFVRALALVLFATTLTLAPTKALAHGAFGAAMGGMGHGGGGHGGGGHGGFGGHGGWHGQSRGGHVATHRTAPVIGASTLGGVAGAVGVASVGPPPPPPPDFTQVTRPYVRLGIGYAPLAGWREPSPDGTLRLTGLGWGVQTSVGVMVHDRVAVHFDAEYQGLSFSRATLGGGAVESYKGRGADLIVGGGVTFVQPRSGFIATAGLGTGRNAMTTAGGNGHSRFGLAGYGGVGIRIPMNDQRGSHMDLLARVSYLDAPDETRVHVLSGGLTFAVER